MIDGILIDGCRNPQLSSDRAWESDFFSLHTCWHHLQTQKEKLGSGTSPDVQYESGLLPKKREGVAELGAKTNDGGTNE